MGSLDLKSMFIACGIIGAIVVALCWGVVTSIFHRTEFKTSEKLKPVRTQLTIVDNKVDTIYIYKIPKE